MNARRILQLCAAGGVVLGAALGVAGWHGASAAVSTRGDDTLAERRVAAACVAGMKAKGVRFQRGARRGAPALRGGPPAC